MRGCLCGNTRSYSMAVQVARIDWHSEKDVAAAAAAAYDVVIASDVAYYQPDVRPLAQALRAIRAPSTVIVAPMFREAAHALSDELEALGSVCVEHCLTLVRSDAEPWFDEEAAQGSPEGSALGPYPPPEGAVPHMPALAFRLLVVSWP